MKEWVMDVMVYLLTCPVSSHHQQPATRLSVILQLLFVRQVRATPWTRTEVFLGMMAIGHGQLFCANKYEES